MIANRPTMKQQNPAKNQALRTLFVENGTVVECSGNRPFLIQGEDSVWWLDKGHIELFATAVEDGKPDGPRSHFASIPANSLLFGINFDAIVGASGFLAMGVVGTRLYRIPLKLLQSWAAQHPEYLDILAHSLDTWLETLSQGITKEILPAPLAQHQLSPNEDQEVSEKDKVRAKKEVVWVPADGEILLFIDMEAVMALEPGLFFPITRKAWSSILKPVDLKPVSTADALRNGHVWEGLKLFHESLCLCEFINKRLVLADEYLRLRDKDEFSASAQSDALREIQSVLDKSETFFQSTGEDDAIQSALKNDLFAAVKLVGDYTSIAVRIHPDMDKPNVKDPFDLIASASNFRYRRVALRDDWWRRDHGPMLAFIEEGHRPVALIPHKPGHYHMVDPSTRQRVPVTEVIAETLEPFALFLFRPFPEEKVRVRDLLSYGMHRQKSDVLWIFGLAVVVALIGLATPYLTGKLFDVVIPSADRGLLLQLFLGLFFAGVAMTAFGKVQEFCVLRVTGKMNFNLQAAMWDRLLNLPTPFFRSYTSGDLADRADAVNEIEEVISEAGITTILAGFTSAFNLILLFKYSWRLTLVAFGLVLVSLIITLILNLLQLKHLRQMMDNEGRLSGLVFQLISGISKLRVSGAENHAFSVWARRFSEQKRINLKVERISNVMKTFESTWPIITTMVIYAMVLFFAKRALPDNPDQILTTGEFLGFNAAFGVFLGGVLQMGMASISLFSIIPIFQRAKPILETEPEIHTDRSHPGQLTGSIEVKNLRFRYDPTGPLIVNDVSLNIEPGQFVAFVGPSGSGKSTIFRLLLGFEEPEGGAIYYDDNELASLDLRSVRKQIGVVLQNGQLIPADIFNNIILGKSHLTIENAWDAARKAGMEKDIKNMPMGMHTVISEGGGTLSGGQRQRLMIARAIVDQPRILLFDEATSALDNTTQQIVSNSLDQMQSTRIVIAHRLSTIRNADRIFVIDAGKLVESGNYEELMDMNGVFHELASRQIL